MIANWLLCIAVIYLLLSIFYSIIVKFLFYIAVIYVILYISYLLFINYR